MLWDETQPELENRDTTSSEIDSTYDITVIEQKISERVGNKQKRQRYKQEKYILVAKDMLHTSSTVFNCEAQTLHVHFQYCADH